MPHSDIPLSPNQVELHRREQQAAFDTQVSDLIRWLTTEAVGLPLHQVSGPLFAHVTTLALVALSLWSALRLDEHVPAVRVYGKASYRFHAWRREPVRTRFGVFYSFEPVYRLIDGTGPRCLFPHARRIGLAAGRMSLSVHLLVAELVTRMPFAPVREVADAVGLWVPGPRAMLGIVDRLGPEAIAEMHSPQTPTHEGTHVIIEQDDGGIPHVRPEELEKRRRPNQRKTRARGRQTRLQSRRRRRGKRVDRRRRQKGDKSKNCRMATIYVLYTLEVHADGTVEGPLNRQVFGATRDKDKLRKTVLRAAKARGWGVKPSIYLADGASSHWTAWKRTFHAGTPCVDWYHVAEYLWDAADAVFRVAQTAPKGKRARKAFNKKKNRMEGERSKWVRARQDELLAGKIDVVLQEVQKLGERVGRTGPGTRGRRKKVKDAVTYLTNHKKYLTYSTIGHIVMGTGVVEGMIKQIGARLKGPGMRWSVERAERMLALRCLQLSGQRAWKRFTERVREHHEAVTSLHVPAVSPTEELTAYSAVRKAA